MEDRKRIDIEDLAPMVIDIEGSRFSFPDCYNFAEIGNVQAGITDHVLKSRDSRFIRLTVVSDARVPDAYGVRRGWYVARFIDHEDAVKIRESWGVLRKQPEDPSFRWR